MRGDTPRDHHAQWRQEMTRTPLAAAIAAAALLPIQAAAQTMDPGMHMPMPAKPKPKPTPKPQRKPAPKPAPKPAAAPAQSHDEHSPMQAMPGMEGMTPPAEQAAPPPQQQHDQHAGMDMPPTPGDGAAQDLPVGAIYINPVRWGSGTSRLPANELENHNGLDAGIGPVMLMAHGDLTAVATSQSGPRGDDMTFVESMAMLTASLGSRSEGISFDLRTMMSLEPAMGARGYPNLLATGETAGGVPLVDRQHPHDLFMELSGRLAYNFGRRQAVFLYGGPVGEPALGPSNFMHRRSARDLVLAPITHHWFDSTHISYGVVTLGYASRRFQIEASAFRGQEPDERRWGIEKPKLDSWSARATWSPDGRWLGEISYARLESPEPQHPGEDEKRLIASLHYSFRDWSATAAFSAKKHVPGDTSTAWLLELNKRFGYLRPHSVTARIENLANDELFSDPLHPLHGRSFRVTRIEAGYAWRHRLGDVLTVTVGGNAMAILKPDALDPYYGKSPFGWTGFVRLSLGDR
jgi:hypothetical protein